MLLKFIVKQYICFGLCYDIIISQWYRRIWGVVESLVNNITILLQRLPVKDFRKSVFNNQYQRVRLFE